MSRKAVFIETKPNFTLLPHALRQILTDLMMLKSNPGLPFNKYSLKLPTYWAVRFYFPY